MNKISVYTLNKREKEGVLFVYKQVSGQVSGKNGQTDHLIPEQIDHPYRNKLTTSFQFKMTTSFRVN